MSPQYPAIIHCQWLGSLPYLAAWDLQKRLAVAVARAEHPPSLLLLEHPHTYTVGRSGHPENLLWDEGRLAKMGIEVHQVDRGGDITYHGPGQLVGYPILPLGAINPDGHLPQPDYLDYLRRLEGVLIRVLQVYGVTAVRRDGLTGVWVGGPQAPRKIASIGVKVNAAGVSQHGFALNIKPDMNYWNGIVACGIPGVEMISLAQLLEPAPSTEHVAHVVMDAFSEAFGCQVRTGLLLPTSAA